MLLFVCLFSVCLPCFIFRFLICYFIICVSCLLFVMHHVICVSFVWCPCVVTLPLISCFMCQVVLCALLGIYRVICIVHVPQFCVYIWRRFFSSVIIFIWVFLCLWMWLVVCSWARLCKCVLRVLSFGIRGSLQWHIDHTITWALIEIRHYLHSAMLHVMSGATHPALQLSFNKYAESMVYAHLHNSGYGRG